MSPEGEGSIPPERKKYCAQCGRELSQSVNFCPDCGHAQKAPAAPTAPTYYPPYVPPKTFSLRDLGRGLGTYGALALFILTAVNLVILLWGTALVWPNLDRHITLYVVTPFIVPLYELGGGISFFLYYLFMAAVITASFLWMVKKSYRPLTEELAFKEPKSGHSPLYIIATIFMAVVAFNVIFNLAVASGGTEPTTPDFESRELWTLIYGFAHASVWEELITRVLLIGIPLLVVDAVLSRTSGKSMRQLHQYILGGGFAFGKKEVFFLAFSSIIFGMAHVFAWDLWKIIPAAVGGLAFGYLFLKLGLYASIMLHFMIDFLSIPMDVFPNSLAPVLIIGLLTIFWIIMGIPYFIRYAARGLGWITGKKVWPDAPRNKPRPAAAYQGSEYPLYQPPQYPPAYPPQQYAPSQQGPWQQPSMGQSGASAPQPVYAPPRPRDPTAIGFMCPHCGNTEATYKDGQLTCTKCGKS